MSKKLLIRDLTLRDGQQSLFATRMTQAQVDYLLPDYQDANFYAMEVWGGAVPDSVMRYLGENPWTRLKTIHDSVGNVSKLTALSRGRNLFGYTPYTEEIIEGFCKTSINNGLGIMRIFDALNDTNNIKSTIKYVKKYGGIADCAVCYTIDPHFSTMERIKAFFKGKPLPKPVFTDQYFLDLALEMEKLGADMISIKDMSGLIPPMRVAKLVKLFKANLSIPVDFHTHCTPGYGLAAVLCAVMSGADIVDTNIWNFAGGSAGVALELIYLFAKKLGIEMDVNMEAVAKINAKLVDVRKELKAFDAYDSFPNPFNPLTDTLPPHVDKLFNDAIAAVNAGNEDTLLDICHQIEDYFNFPKPNTKVKEAEVPGGMYSNMVAQLKALGSDEILDEAMKLIPQVRMDAGLPPLVTPTSQIVGAQAVNAAMSLKQGKEMYSNTSNQFQSLVKGDYGKTPIPVKPEFRKQICGFEDERPFDTSTYKSQDNPTLAEFGGVKLAENYEEELLLELFPLVAKGFLKKLKKEQFEAKQKEAAAAQAVEEVVVEEKVAKPMKMGKKVLAPMPGRVISVLVKTGDKVEKGQPIVILESMKMENNIVSDFSGFVNHIIAEEGETIAADSVMLDIVNSEDEISALSPA
ncbi:biotin/lipoyl-containing protein [Flammeovirga sp. EKP202]|uniref:biotin/lipoyl-containing protein n=1 Tax=Flammeovirga sp. EKP202 TaxID=2770592 RepID=UPI00165EECE3|nr:biotin/lipoyl-containing protein [Flammeovirga sp. EKP202]MBD0401584.1 biotin/lipoyl-binding protein [Flammeovirga sp. EKP202]